MLSNSPAYEVERLDRPKNGSAVPAIALSCHWRLVWGTGLDEGPDLPASDEPRDDLLRFHACVGIEEELWREPVFKVA